MRVLTQQPRGNVSVDWSNSISRGLISAFLPSQTQRPITDLVTRLQDTAVIKPVYSVGPGGIAYGSKGDGTGDDNWSIITSPSNLSFSNIGVSVLCVFETTEVGAIGTTALWGAGFSSSDYAKIKKLPDGNIRWEYSNNTGGFIVTSTPPAIRKVHVAIGTQRFGGANYREFYIDGQLISVDTSVQTNLTGSIGFIGAYTTGAPGGARVYGAFVWKRELSPQEVASLSANPWQLFRTQPSMAERAFSKFQILPEPGYFDQIDYGSTLTRTNFPRQHASIDRSNSLTKNMTFLWTAAEAKRGDIAGKNLILAYYPSYASFGVIGTNLGSAFSTSENYQDGIYLRTPDSATELNSEIRPKNTSWTFGGLFKTSENFVGNDFWEPITFGNQNSSTQFNIGFYPEQTQLGGNTNNKLFLRVKENSGAFTYIYSDYTYGYYTYTPNRTKPVLLAVVVVAENNNIRWYINGVLQSQTITTIANVGAVNDYYSSVSGNARSYMAFATTDVWTQAEVTRWTQNPWQLFKPLPTVGKKLLRSLTFDVPQAITKSSYVQTAGIPRKPVPVNMAHPLARDIKFASGPVWGSRDAVDSRVIYTEAAGFSNTVAMTRYGLAFLPANISFFQSVGNTNLPNYTSHTLMIVGNIEADQYPVGNTNGLLGVDWNDNNGFQLRVDGRGLTEVGILNNSGAPRYLKGSQEVFPLRRLGVAICVVEAGVGTTLYVNGKIAGFTTRAESSRGAGSPRRIGYNLYGQQGNSSPKQYLSAGWGRALSPTEVQQISENPWQIFQQPSKFKNRYAEAVEAVLDISRKFLLFFG